MLRATTSPVYVRTPFPGSVAAVLEAVSGLDEPPQVRVLAPRPPLLTGLEEARRSGRDWEAVDGREVAFRASDTLVTDTAVVSEEGVTQFVSDPEVAMELPAAGSGSFVESVYEAHARAWDRAIPVTTDGLTG